VKQKRQPFPVPYGLFLVLGVYALMVLIYVWSTYWRSPEYLAAEHYQQAADLLGLDDGQTASKEALLSAYEHYLEAARLVPKATVLQKRVEAMRWRLDQRGFKLDHDLTMRAEAVAMLWQRIQQQGDPLLVVGARDRGWQPDQLLEGPTRSLLWSLPGFGLLIAIWAWLRFSGQAVRERQREEELKKIEAENAEVDAERQRRPSKPKPKLKTRRSNPR
jgi:hypothetical protein